MPRTTDTHTTVRMRRTADLSLHADAPEQRVPWSTDRWGRFLAGVSVLCFSILGLIVHPYFLAGTLLAAFNLVLTSLTDACPLRALLRRLGVKEREDLYLPGGRPRV